MDAILLLLLCPGQVVVAADDSPESWQVRAQYRCRDEQDDAVTCNAAAQAAAKAMEELHFGPGYYCPQTPIVIPRGVPAVRGVGAVYFRQRGDFDGWLLTIQKLKLARVEGVSFIGNNKARGLLIDDCHDTIVSRVFCYKTPEAIRCEKAWMLHLDTIRAEECQTVTEPLFLFRSFGNGSLRGLSVNKCRGGASILDVDGGKSVVEQTTIEYCESSEAPLVRMLGLGSRFVGFHGEHNASPVQILLHDSRQSIASDVQFTSSRSDWITVGVQVNGSQQCVVRNVLAQHCEEAVVRIDSYSQEHDCRAERIDLWYERSWYDGSWPSKQPPKHLVDYSGG